MPAISKIRFTNVIYEGGAKRYNDDIFNYEGYNGAFLLENGGGKTVFIQTVLQAVIPNIEVADRKIKDTLVLTGNASHIAIEWILSNNPRRYGVTAVTLFMGSNGVDFYRYTYEYSEDDKNSIENIPFVKENINGTKRAAGKEEIHEYYLDMVKNHMHAQLFDSNKKYHKHLEENFKIYHAEWRSIARINAGEGGVEAFFDNCKTTTQLVDNLLIPVIEEAMAGRGAKDFADIFENQREHFKNYTQLKGRINESKLIDKEINKYVEVFSKYHKLSEELNTEKGRVKFLNNYIKEEKTSLEDKFGNVEKDIIECGKNKSELHRKELSYDIAVLKEEFKELYKLCNQYKDDLNEKKRVYEEADERLQNLQIARIKHNINEKNQKLQYLEEELENLDKNFTVEEIKINLNKSCSLLKGVFVGEKEALEKLKVSHEEKVNTLEKEKQSEAEALKGKIEEKNSLNGEIIKLETTINNLEKDIERIKNRILSSPATDVLEREMEKWKENIVSLNSGISSYQQQIPELRHKREELREKLKELREKEKTSQGELNNYNTIFDTISKERTELTGKLISTGIVLSEKDDIYLKESSVLSSLEAKVEALKREKENLIFEERAVYRFLDDYKENSCFTADPFLYKIYENLRSSIKTLELGSMYAKRASAVLGRGIDALYKDYPYWVNSLIVDEAEENKLLEKLKDTGDKLLFPMVILKEKEAREIASGNFSEKDKHKTIYPNMWKNNISKDYFMEWKQSLQGKAETVTELRKNKESEISFYENILNSTKGFFNKYPHEYYLEVKNCILNFTQLYNDITSNIRNKELKREELEKEERELSLKLKEAEQNLDNTSGKLILAQDCIQKKKSIDNYNISLQGLLNKFKNLDEEIYRINNIIQAKEEAIKEEDKKATSVSTEITLLEADSYYKQVEGFEPEFGNKAKSILKTEIEGLKDQLHEIQKDRKGIEDRITETRSDISKLHRDLNIKSSEVKYEIIDIDYEEFYEKEIEALIAQVKKLEKSFKTANSAYDLKNEELNKIRYKIENKRDDFYKKYEKLFDFNIPLITVNQQLLEEKKSIKTLEEELLKSSEKLKSELTKVKNSLFELEKKNEKFDFLKESVKEVAILREELNNFSYEREKYVNKLIAAVEALSDNLNSSEENVNKNRNDFRNFCDSKIEDIKMRQMSLNGIDYNKGYEDVIKWQKNMQDRINRTVQMLEEDIREHDKELEQFIEHLHSYLTNIVEEMKLIPKKTRIKVEEDWKEVYIFNIPTWNETEGKSELRKHINWILNQLEGDKFIGEDGRENTNLIRKEIEKWFGTKQLLRNVLKNEEIKIRCRKVRNEGTISSTSFTWETSNSWSGGEKWSKNMTLFLGLLNYLAEKRNLISNRGKIHRTVILDNPFGKASSDHVLDPVFMIAEQLGFQIIALTAHAEGAFIRKYFPVVYSCKLRYAANGESQIISKEREIKQAFFIDKEPQSLLRLNAAEQMSLFN